MGCKALCLNALTGLFVSVIVNLSLYGFPGGLEEKQKDPLGGALGKVHIVFVLYSFNTSEELGCH